VKLRNRRLSRTDLVEFLRVGVTEGIQVTERTATQHSLLLFGEAVEMQAAGHEIERDEGFAAGIQFPHTKLKLAAGDFLRLDRNGIF
jgi:hypothetical protein